MRPFSQIINSAAICLLSTTAANAAITITASDYRKFASFEASQFLQGPNLDSGVVSTTGMLSSSAAFTNNTVAPTPPGTGNIAATSTGTYSEVGSGTSSVVINATLKDSAVFTNVTHPVSANSQPNASQNRNVTFTVDTPGLYSFTFNLSQGTFSPASASTSNYHYYGTGGDATVFDGATSLYTTSSGNFGDKPVGVVYTTTTTLTLAAGTPYTVETKNYLYHGSGGSGTLEDNVGWQTTIVAVPEPTAGLLALSVLGAALVRRRR